MGSEMKPDRHSTSPTKASIVTQAITTEGHNENNPRKKAQLAPWEDKNFLQKAEGTSDPIRLPSTKEILVPKKDETWNHDRSLTLVVGDDYEREKEDIVMIDLTTQDDPIPTNRTPIDVFSKSILKEDISMANVQPVLPEKQTQKVKVEISLPHPLPTEERNNSRPSVSFASPVESQRYPWTEASTPARKQKTDLGVFET